MALRQTYLSLRSKIPPDAEIVLVMRGRGNDELAPSKQLLDEFNALKSGNAPDSGFESAIHFAWAQSNFAERFLAQIRGSEASMARLKALAVVSRSKDIFLVCYEGYDKPCHRKLLLEAAENSFGANVDASPFVPESEDRASSAGALFEASPRSTHGPGGPAR